MSQIYITALVLILVQLNNVWGLNFGSDQLTQVATTLVTLAGAAWIAYRRHQMGDITAVGSKKA